MSHGTRARLGGRTFAARVWPLGVALTLVVGCIVDDDKLCGAHQVKTTGAFEGCICAPGYAWSADGKHCVPCGEHEVVRDGACACEAGFARPKTGAACEATSDAGAEDAGEPMDTGAPSGPTGQGTPCVSSDDCADLYATFCQTLQPPNICLIQGCATGEHVCTAPDICCSFEGFPLLASTNGLCIPADSCTGPGKPVTP